MSSTSPQCTADQQTPHWLRYHVAGGKGVFYARAPYMNKDLGAGAHATRFIGLAPVGNAGKQKFLHALALVPAVDMDQKALTVRFPLKKHR